MRPFPSRKTGRHKFHDSLSCDPAAVTSQQPPKLDALHINEDADYVFGMDHGRYKERRVEYQTLESMRQEVCMYLDAMMRSMAMSTDTAHSMCRREHASLGPFTSSSLLPSPPHQDCSVLSKDSDKSCCDQGYCMRGRCNTHVCTNSSEKIVQLMSTLFDSVREAYRILCCCFHFKGNPCDVFEPVHHLSLVTMHLLLTYGHFTYTPDREFVVLGGSGPEELPWVGCLMMVLHRILQVSHRIHHNSDSSSSSSSLPSVSSCSLLAWTAPPAMRTARPDASVDRMRAEGLVDMSAPLSTRVLLLNCHNFGWLDEDQEKQEQLLHNSNVVSEVETASSTRYRDSCYTHRCINVLLNKAVYSYRALHRYARHRSSVTAPTTASHARKWTRPQEQKKQNEEEKNVKGGSSIIDAAARATSATVVLLANTILIDGGAPSLDVWHSGTTSTAHECYGRGLASVVIPARLSENGRAASACQSHPDSAMATLTASKVDTARNGNTTNFYVNDIKHSAHLKDCSHERSCDGDPMCRVSSTSLPAGGAVNEEDDAMYRRQSPHRAGLTDSLRHSCRHAVTLGAVGCGSRAVAGMVAQALLLHPHGPLVLHTQFSLPMTTVAATNPAGGASHVAATGDCVNQMSMCEAVFDSWVHTHCRCVTSPMAPFRLPGQKTRLPRHDCAWHRDLLACAAWMLHVLSAPQPVLLVEWHLPEQQKPSCVANTWRAAATNTLASPCSLVLRVLACYRDHMNYTCRTPSSSAANGNNNMATGDDASSPVCEAVTAVTRAMCLVAGWSSRVGGACVGDGCLRPWIWARGLRVYVDTAEECASSYVPPTHGGVYADACDGDMEGVVRERRLVLTSLFIDEDVTDG